MCIRDRGLGTSMLQMPNIIRRPVIWLPAILSSIILGPISTCLLRMPNNPTGSGMGTCGLVGQIMAFQTMTQAGTSAGVALVQILLMHILLPAILALGISEDVYKRQVFRLSHLHQICQHAIILLGELLYHLPISSRKILSLSACCIHTFFLQRDGFLLQLLNCLLYTTRCV